MNQSHHYIGSGASKRINQTALWVECTKYERVHELQQILLKGFSSGKMRQFSIFDVNARKYRNIYEPNLWPDQYVHHALIQVLEPIMMRGMDYWCCGSIQNRGSKHGILAIKKWLRYDKYGTKYAMELDIHHFYESIQPVRIMTRMRHLIKDGKVMKLIYSIVRDGVKIGSYCSQWFANVLLQPLDMLIRQSHLCSYYVRYMDNLTIFGPNKRHMFRLKAIIEEWLNGADLKLKQNWQIFRVDRRMVNAMGYRYDHQKCFVRKNVILRLKRQANKVRKRLSHDKRICYHVAASILSRFGHMKYGNTFHLRNRICLPGFIYTLKSIVRNYCRKHGESKWKNIVLAMELYV